MSWHEGGAKLHVSVSLPPSLMPKGGTRLGRLDRKMQR